MCDNRKRNRRCEAGKQRTPRVQRGIGKRYVGTSITKMDRTPNNSLADYIYNETSVDYCQHFANHGGDLF